MRRERKRGEVGRRAKATSWTRKHVLYETRVTHTTEVAGLNDDSGCEKGFSLLLGVKANWKAVLISPDDIEQQNSTHAFLPRYSICFVLAEFGSIGVHVNHPKQRGSIYEGLSVVWGTNFSAPDSSKPCQQTHHSHNL